MADFGRENSFFIIMFSCFLVIILLFAALRLKLAFDSVVCGSFRGRAMWSSKDMVWFFSSFIFDQYALPMSGGIVLDFCCTIDHIVRTPILCRDTTCKQRKKDYYYFQKSEG